MTTCTAAGCSTRTGHVCQPVTDRATCPECNQSVRVLMIGVNLPPRFRDRVLGIHRPAPDSRRYCSGGGLRVRP